MCGLWAFRAGLPWVPLGPGGLPRPSESTSVSAWLSVRTSLRSSPESGCLPLTCPPLPSP